MQNCSILQRQKRKYFLVICAFILCVAVAAIACLFVGSSNMTIGQCIDALMVLRCPAS